jgi:hypothetical protein
MSRGYSLITTLVTLYFLLFTGNAQSQDITRNGFTGVVSTSDSYKHGETFAFANLGSQKPFVTFPSGYGYEFIKMYEDDDIVALTFFASGTGSSDTFYLSRKANSFTLIQVTTIFAKGDIHPNITYGKIQ